MPDNFAPMLDDVPDPDDSGDQDDREALLSERDYGAHEEKVQGEAERRQPGSEEAPGDADADEARDDSGADSAGGEAHR